ncbi:S-adenosyl-L-methionine-dependent methyltransferase [Pluteus cervinus]|uniref:S-adenosyl-L-methionine-dependent methyltransferase n=1 Tax=Pluteus cervinus TaxID=181527 RepID=A0ACD3B8N5_9AGAR|nr:S-adenosyl-L-methionine-dependent methyltransferase [Pluteus cervinus]
MLTDPFDTPEARLPPIDTWRKLFPSTTVHQRVSIRNPETAQSVANAFIPEGSRDKVVIEAYPGPGQLTRALLQLPKNRIRKLIVLEEYEPYLQYLRPLEKLDSRLTVLPINGYAWDSYEEIHNLGLLGDVPKVPWDGDAVHPNLHFISTLPLTVIGEQLIAQLFRSIPDAQWLFQYGRIPLSFLLSEYVWKRVSATTDDISMRCKLSVIAEAVATCQEALPFDSLQPYDEHFHPTRISVTANADRKAKNRRVGNPFQAITVTPRTERIIQKGKLDQWDFCLRRLFVRKATPLKGALSSLAPNGQVLLKKIDDPNLPPEERLNVKKAIRSMSVQDWSILLKAFDEWPFAPDDLSIGDTFIPLKE